MVLGGGCVIRGISNGTRVRCGSGYGFEMRCEKGNGWTSLYSYDGYGSRLVKDLYKYERSHRVKDS